MSTQSMVSFNIPLWQLAGVAVLTQVLIKSNRDDVIGGRLASLIDGLHTGLKHVIWDSPVIAFTGALTYFAHQIIPPHNLNLSLTSLPGAEGSLKVAAFVCGVFALKSALTSYFYDSYWWSIETRLTHSLRLTPSAMTGEVKPNHKKIKEDETIGDILREGIINHFIPLALATFGAYYASIPLKLAQTALYIAGLMGLVKLLGKGTELILADEKISRAIGLANSWVNVESPLAQSTGTPSPLGRGPKPPS